MNYSISDLLESSKTAIRSWWLMLLVGIALFVVGMLVLIFPLASFVGMTLIFGILMFAVGVFELVVAWSGRNVVTGRGWMVVAGIIQVALGILLMWDLGLTAVTLPIFLGFWLMIRSFTLIGLGFDMSSMQIGGWGWTMFTGFMLLACAFIVLVQPLLFGVEAVVLWVGISMLIGGLSSMTFAWQLKNLHKNLA